MIRICCDEIGSKKKTGKDLLFVGSAILNDHCLCLLINNVQAIQKRLFKGHANWHFRIIHVHHVLFNIIDEPDIHDV